jgi:hypothetical protein
MATSARATATLTEAVPSSDSDRKGRALLAWAALLVALALGLPLFLRMPLFFDPVHYDLCARKLLQGGVMYRDVFDNNLPGVVWIHVAVRATLGWGSEALRLVDFGFMTGVVLMLLRWVPGSRWSPARVGTAATLAFFYLFNTEFGHCQRDGWMLVPTTAALCLRDRQLRALVAAPPGATIFRAALVEGLIWGAAFWIKPFAAVPALGCWLVSLICLRRRGTPAMLDAGGLLAGGLFAGALGLAWLAASGSWHSFWDILLRWNGDYAAFTFGRYPRWGTLVSWVLQNLPLSLVHLPAVITAFWAIARSLRDRGRRGSALTSRSLLSGFYLGWLFQAVFIQRAHIYVMIPVVFPAVVLTAGALQTEWRPSLRRAILLLFVPLAIILTPGMRLERVAAWPQCCRERITPELRDRLALSAHWPGGADWQDLARVAAFLRSEKVGDGELVCLSGCTHPLYFDLNVEPPTRFPQIGATTVHFPAHSEEVLAELEAGHIRYVVTDLAADFLTYEHAREETPRDPLALPPAFPSEYLDEYPWCEEVVFRAGRYVVHRVRGPVRRFWDHPERPQ